MTVKPISVEIYTGSHRILGRLSPGASGLYSFLNIPTTSTLEIEGAHISRLHQPSRLVARYGSIWLAKQQIALILRSAAAQSSAPRRRCAAATPRRSLSGSMSCWGASSCAGQ